MQDRVTKCMRDNFPGYTDYQKDCIIRSGKSLRETLEEDIQKRDMGLLAMGCVYFKTKRLEFEDESNPKKRLKVLDPSQEQDASLHKALMVYKANNSLAQFRAWFDRKQDINQKNVIVALRTAHDVNPQASIDNANFIVGIMRWVVRNQILQQYPDACEVSKGLFDQALLKTWKFVKKDSTVTTTAWYEAHEDVVHLLLPKRDLIRCVFCKGDWPSVEKELAEVCASSSTGLAIMGKCFREVVGCKVTTSIREAVCRLEKGEVLKKAVIEIERLKVVAEVEELGKDFAEGFSKAQEGIVTYRGRKVGIKVQSYVEQFNQSVMAMVRSAAVHTGLLEKVSCEDGLADWSPGKVPKVNEELLKEAKLVRKKINAMLDAHDEEGDQSVGAFIASKHSLLLSFDRNWKVEDSFFVSMEGEAGASCLHKLVLSHFPTEEQAICPSKVLAALATIAKSALLRFVGKAQQTMFNIVQSWATAISQHRCPKFGEVAGTPFLAQCRGRMAYFYRCKQAKDQPDLVGRDALLSLMQDVRVKADKKQKLTLATVRPFTVYGWLLEEDEKEIPGHGRTISLVAMWRALLLVRPTRPTRRLRRPRGRPRRAPT